jgi:Fe-S cluster biogenesis protein NfuA
VDETRVAPSGVRVAGQPAPDDLESRRAALEAVMGLMQPAVAADGGDLVLVDADYESGVVRVRLEGACGSCAISSATLQGGVERILKERLAWITEVVGEVDETDAVLGTAPIGRGAYVPRRG